MKRCRANLPKNDVRTVLYGKSCCNFSKFHIGDDTGLLKRFQQINLAKQINVWGFHLKSSAYKNFVCLIPQKRGPGSEILLNAPLPPCGESSAGRRISEPSPAIRYAGFAGEIRVQARSPVLLISRLSCKVSFLRLHSTLLPQTSGRKTWTAVGWTASWDFHPRQDLCRLLSLLEAGTEQKYLPDRCHGETACHRLFFGRT